MTVAEVQAALADLGISEDVWLYTTNPWYKIGTICLQSTYHIYLNPQYDYRFNSTDEVLEIAILDPGRTVKKIVDYENIVCFNGTYAYEQSVPVVKNFR